jgi:hypothetical protein
MGFKDHVWLYRGAHLGDNDGEQKPQVFADKETAKFFLYQEAERFQKHFKKWVNPEKVNLNIETVVDRDDCVKVWCYDYEGIIVKKPVISSIKKVEA